MGFRVSWIAFAGLEPEVVQRKLGLEPNGEPNASEYVEGLDLSALSRELVVLSVSETVMLSTAACWKDGQHRWSVVHNSLQGLADLTLSLECAEIRGRPLMTAQLAGDDCDHVFDVPVELARAVTGFRSSFDEWEVLERR